MRAGRHCAAFTISWEDPINFQDEFPSIGFGVVPCTLDPSAANAMSTYIGTEPGSYFISGDDADAREFTGESGDEVVMKWEGCDEMVIGWPGVVETTCFPGAYAPPWRSGETFCRVAGP